MAPDREKSEALGNDAFPSRKGRLRRPRLVVVIGLWCLCLPNFIASLLVMIDLLVNYRSRSNFFIFWLAVGVLYLTTTIIYRVTRNYLVFAPSRVDVSADYTDDTESDASDSSTSSQL